MVEIINGVQALLDRIMSMPSHLFLVLVLNVLGFVLKKAPVVPNTWIPTIVIFSGTALYPLITNPGTVGPSFSGDPNLILALYGFVIGGLAWLLHMALLRRVEQYLAGLGKKAA